MNQQNIRLIREDYITNGTIEGINNKIKVLKRQIYGFRNEEYFTLRLYDCMIGVYAFNRRTKKKRRYIFLYLLT